MPLYPSASCSTVLSVDPPTYGRAVAGTQLDRQHPPAGGGDQCGRGSEQVEQPVAPDVGANSR